MLPIVYNCECGYKIAGTSFEEITPYLLHLTKEGAPCLSHQK